MYYSKRYDFNCELISPFLFHSDDSGGGWNLQRLDVSGSTTRSLSPSEVCHLPVVVRLKNATTINDCDDCTCNE